MSKADIKIFLKPISETVNEVAEELHFTKSEMKHTNKFRSMGRGDCFVKSPFNSKKLKRNVTDVILSGSIYQFIKLPTNDEKEADNTVITENKDEIQAVDKPENKALYLGTNLDDIFNKL